MIHSSKSTIVTILMFSVFTSFCGASEKESTFQEQAYTSLTGLYAAGKNNIPVFLIDSAEREAQIKEMRAMNWKDVAVPVVTGVVSGIIYAECVHNLTDDAGIPSLAQLIGAKVGIAMAKKALFGCLHEKNKKRDAVDSIDTAVTALIFVLS